MISDLFLDNPFARQHLKDVSLLSGEEHKNTFRDIKRLLNLSKTKANSRSILINGDRGTGKTSMIQLIENEASNLNCIPVTFFLSDRYKDKTVEFFDELYSLLFKRCLRSDVLIDEVVAAQTAIARGELPDDPRKWVFNFVRKYLEYKRHSDRPINLLAEDISADFELMIGQLRRKEEFGANAKLTIIIDEAQRIFDNPRILNIIRHLIQEEIGVTFILASQIIHDDSVIRQVFDRIERAFRVYELKQFASDKDVRDYLERSLKSVGWKEKDFRLNIQKPETLIAGIYRLTNGKPEFINWILEKMFDRVQDGIDRKLRLNDHILIEIASHIESSSPDSKDYTSGPNFNLSRAEYIVALRGDRLKWFRYLSKSQLRSTPNEVYDFMNIFTVNDIRTKEQFEQFITELYSKEIIVQISREKNKNDELGFAITRNESKSPIDTQYAYLGSNSEKVWTNLMLGMRKYSVMYGFQHPSETFMQEVLFIAGFHGKRTLIAKSIDRFILNREGLLYEHGKKWDIPGFFDCLKKGLVNIEDFEIHFVRFLFDMFKSNEQVIYICAVNIQFSGRSLANIAYQEGSYSEKKREELSILFERGNNESRKIDFQLCEVKRDNLLSTEEFSDIIRSSDNEEIKRVVYMESVKPATELYMDDPESNRNDIIQWLDCIYHGVLAGEDIKFQELNNSGYMFLNLHEDEKAQICFDRAYMELKRKNITDPDLEDITAVLIVYNKGVVKALLQDFTEAIALFNEAVEMSDMVREFDIGALNFLFKNEQGDISLGETKEQNIDLVELALSNVDLLKQG